MCRLRTTCIRLSSVRSITGSVASSAYQVLTDVEGQISNQKSIMLPEATVPVAPLIDPLRLTVLHDSARRHCISPDRPLSGPTSRSERGVSGTTAGESVIDELVTLADRSASIRDAACTAVGAPGRMRVATAINVIWTSNLPIYLHCITTEMFMFLVSDLASV